MGWDLFFQLFVLITLLGCIALAVVKEARNKHDK